MNTKRGLRAVALLVSSIVVLCLAGCDDCDENTFDEHPDRIVACQSGRLTVRSARCSGEPEACSYVASGTKLSFTVTKEICSTRFGHSDAGCSQDVIEFDCSGPPLAAGMYAFNSSSGVAKLEVGASGSCVGR